MRDVTLDSLPLVCAPRAAGPHTPGISLHPLACMFGAAHGPVTVSTSSCRHATRATPLGALKAETAGRVLIECVQPGSERREGCVAEEVEQRGCREASAVRGAARPGGEATGPECGAGL
eukprot:876952-Prymnesium_polylepis.1